MRLYDTMRACMGIGNVVILCCIILFASSCLSSGNGDKKYDDLHTGSEGLVLDVGNFKNTVFEGEQFEIPLMFENKGTTDITSNIFGLFTFKYDTFFLSLDSTYEEEYIDNDPEYLMNTEQTMQMPDAFGGVFLPGGFLLMPISTFLMDLNENFGGASGVGNPGTFSVMVLARGKSREIPQGDRVPGRIPFVANNLNPTSQYHKTRILTQLCYPYVSMFETDICINQDKFGLDVREKACDEGDVSIPPSQGGPIAVEDVEVTFATRDGSTIPRFLIRFKNVGHGTPFVYKHKDVQLFSHSASYADDIYEACTSRAQERNNWNRALVVPFFLDVPLQCSNGNVLIFDEYGVAETYCSFEERASLSDVYEQTGRGDYGSLWGIFNNVSANSVMGSFVQMTGTQANYAEQISNMLRGQIPTGQVDLQSIPQSFKTYFLIKTAYFYVENDGIDVVIERCEFC